MYLNLVDIQLNLIVINAQGRLRLDKKSIIRQYRNLQRAKTKSNINLIILFMFCEPQIILTLRRLVKINSICKCCNISVNKTIDAQVQALLSVICAARFHAHVSLAGKEGVILSVRSGGTNR